MAAAATESRLVRNNAAAEPAAAGCDDRCLHPSGFPVAPAGRDRAVPYRRRRAQRQLDRRGHHDRAAQYRADADRSAAAQRQGPYGRRPHRVQHAQHQGAWRNRCQRHSGFRQERQRSQAELEGFALAARWRSRRPTAGGCERRGQADRSARSLPVRFEHGRIAAQAADQTRRQRQRRFAAGADRRPGPRCRQGLGPCAGQAGLGAAAARRSEGDHCATRSRTVRGGLERCYQRNLHHPDHRAERPARYRLHRQYRQVAAARLSAEPRGTGRYRYAQREAQAVPAAIRQRESVRHRHGRLEAGAARRPQGPARQFRSLAVRGGLQGPHQRQHRDADHAARRQARHRVRRQHRPFAAARQCADRRRQCRLERRHGDGAEAGPGRRRHSPGCQRPGHAAVRPQGPRRQSRPESTRAAARRPCGVRLQPAGAAGASAPGQQGHGAGPALSGLSHRQAGLGCGSRSGPALASERRCQRGPGRRPHPQRQTERHRTGGLSPCAA